MNESSLKMQLKKEKLDAVDDKQNKKTDLLYLNELKNIDKRLINVENTSRKVEEFFRSTNYSANTFVDSTPERKGFYQMLLPSFLPRVLVFRPEE
ncbi:hypothetical protein CANARDRAFT_175842 [[Candida] arabinofermentans NRRL YB-2248]|uniref:Uncharacterized protein n=1 Tax=[Candida] arabinofermentans NRRL YB-2248 TaxID=983967 RepID=A0A1E4T0X0_9ASCO|nr:hypothetical protein CANARDRAFT_175842 [[Candida] arabinofermentans NRRL YB-2248]